MGLRPIKGDENPATTAPWRSRLGFEHRRSFRAVTARERFFNRAIFRINPKTVIRPGAQ